MSWYKYHQNNSGGTHIYDKNNGISVNVWVEADNEVHADDRAESIGIYFDGSMDCSCCGSRWSSADYAYNDKDELPPGPEETLKKDEFDSFSTIKWSHDGQYETFVHPLGESFYGAHAEIEIVRKLTYGAENGYGFIVRRADVDEEPYAVSELGCDKEGNRSAPSPGYQHYRLSDYDEYFLNEVGMRIKHVAQFEYASVWSPTKELAEKAIREINAYLDVSPRPNAVRQLFKLWKFEEFTPEVIPLFD
jgi:hypothetical protein